MNFRYKLMQFLSGRYGSDETMLLIIAIASVLAIINCFIHSGVLQLIVYILILLAFIRSFSRNIEARRKENRAVKSVIDKFRYKHIERQRRKSDYTHIYKKCPYCKATLRLPHRLGKHTTICPKCNRSFTVNVRK